MNYKSVFIAICLFTLTSTGKAQDVPVHLTVGYDAASTESLRQVLGLRANQALEPVWKAELPVVGYDFEVESPDGMVIHGEYFSTPRRQNAPVVLFLHDMRETREMFREFSRDLLDLGYSVVLLDLRGYGESNRYANGRTFDTREMENDPEGEQWRAQLKDMESVLLWLDERNLIKSGGVYLLGMRVGSVIGSMVIQEYGRIVSGGVLIAPPQYFRRINTVELLGSVQGRPLLILAADHDRGSINTLREIQGKNPSISGEILQDIPARQQLHDTEKGRALIVDFLDAVTKK